MKKESESLLASSGAGAGAATAPATPVSSKSKTSAAGAKSGTGKRGRKEKTTTEDVDAGDDHNDQTLSKKRKVTKKDTGVNVEKEQMEGKGTRKAPAEAKTGSSPKSPDATARGNKGADAEVDDEATMAADNGANGEAESV